jgi:transcription termination factor NusB
MGQYDDIISENIESIDHELKKLNNNFYQLNKTLNGFLNLALIESSLKNKTPDQVAKVSNAFESIKAILKEK